MGNQRQYLESGGFNEYLYKSLGEFYTSNGVTAKILDKYENGDIHAGLPTFSNSKEVYIKLNDETGEPEQMRIYMNRMPIKDFDWDHSHGDVCSGTVHVHTWKEIKGKFKRNTKVRKLTGQEISRYKELFKMLRIDVQLK